MGSVSILSDSCDESTRAAELEEEVALLREKLDRKNKALAEIQRQIAQSEALSAKKDEQVKTANKALQQSESEKQSLQQSLRLSEKKTISLQETIKSLKKDHHQELDLREKTIAEQSTKIAELEKFVRTLQNEKAVLSAGVEARESKLSRMEELQQSFSEMSSRIQDEDVLHNEIADTNRRCNQISGELEQAMTALADSEARVEQLGQLNAALTEELEMERTKTASHHTDIETLQLRTQKLLAERNSYKQKGDSLSKEMSRICRNGRTIRDIERIIVDEALLRQEVELLREQKRKAREELDYYRTAYEQSRSAQQMAGSDTDIASVLERNVELERLLSELTEYVHAKEMQLDTLMQINDAIQRELKELTKSTMSKNLSSNDV